MMYKVYTYVVKKPNNVGSDVIHIVIHLLSKHLIPACSMPGQTNVPTRDEILSTLAFYLDRNRLLSQSNVGVLSLLVLCSLPLHPASHNDHVARQLHFQNVQAG